MATQLVVLFGGHDLSTMQLHTAAHLLSVTGSRSCLLNGATAGAGVGDAAEVGAEVDMALDTALEAFPEEELVQRDQIISLMANFKAALARAREAETRVRHACHATDLS